MYSSIYELFSSALFDNSLTALQANTVEVLATACTIAIGIAPLALVLHIIIHFFDF